MDGVLLVLVALLLSRTLPSIRARALRLATAAYLALMLAYGFGNVANDFWLEQVVKRGWTSSSSRRCSQPRARRGRGPASSSPPWPSWLAWFGREQPRPGGGPRRSALVYPDSPVPQAPLWIRPGRLVGLPRRRLRRRERQGLRRDDGLAGLLDRRDGPAAGRDQGHDPAALGDVLRRHDARREADRAGRERRPLREHDPRDQRLAAREAGRREGDGGRARRPRTRR